MLLFTIATEIDKQFITATWLTYAITMLWQAYYLVS